MLKILVVDDEEMLCKSLVIKIKHAMPHIDHQTHYVLSGEEAVKYIESNTINLVIIDMKMPGTSGLETIDHIKKHDASILFIVLSAHDEYAFVRESFVRGVVDYLLKPVSIVNLRQSIDKYINEYLVEGNNHAITEIILNYAQYSDKSFVVALSNNRFNFIDFFSLDSFSVISFNSSHSVANFRTKIVTLCKNYLQNNLWICVRVNTRKVLVVINLNKDQQTINDIIAKLADDYHINNPDHIIGVSAINTGIKGLFLCLHQAECAFFSRFLLPNRYVYYYDSTVLSINEPSHSVIDLNNIFSFEARSLYVNLQNLIDQYFNSDYLKGRSYKEIITLYDQIHLFVNEYLKNKKANTLMNKKNLLEFTSILHVKQHLLDYIQQIIEIADVESKISTSPGLVAKTFIDTHYHEYINLRTLSDKLHMNYTYISEMIKKETGYTFSEYLMKTRMEKSIELICKNDDSIQSIARSVGYENYNHFTRNFKTYTGISPSNFRRQRLCQDMTLQ